MSRLACRTVVAWVALAAAVFLTSPARAQTDTPSRAPETAPAWPADIDPNSGFRLPLPRREDLDEAGRKTYDRGATPGANIAGLQGPAGIMLYSPNTSAAQNGLSTYLRQHAGFSPRTREIALITTSREMDNQFEWTAHEPEAVKAGVPRDVIDAIKYRRSTDGLEEADAVVIDLGRQIWRDHKVTPETFARARKAFGERKLVELVLLMGSHATTAALLTTFDMQLHKGSKPLLPLP